MGYFEGFGVTFRKLFHGNDDGRVVTVETLPVQAAWRHVRDFLLETGRLVPIRRYDENLLSIFTKDVLARIQSGDAAWETMVPAVVAQTIKAKRLFGHTQAPGRP